MTTLRLPVAIATNTNYSTGPDVGTPTKVDPASTADGFVNGQIIAAQHVNFELNRLQGAARRALTVAALRLHEVRLEGTAITDTAESMAAVAIGEGYPVLACKTAQALGVTDCGRFVAQGVPASITSLVNGAAFDPVSQRILIIGTGGNRCTYSDDDGETWSAGADIGFAPEAVVWNATEARFIVRVGTSNKRSTTGAAAWAAGGAISVAGDGGLAVLSNGDVIAAGYDAFANTFSKSTDAGANWADTAGTIPNAADSADGGWVVGNEGAFVYHIARLTAGANSFQISRSADGDTWGVVKNFPMPHTGATANRPKILMCQNTGLLVALMPITPALGSGSNTLTMIAMSLDGSDWSEALYVENAPINAFGVAGGRLLFTRDEMLFASSGIGWS